MPYRQLPECNSGLYNKVSKRYLQSLAMREVMRAAYLWGCERGCIKTKYISCISPWKVKSQLILLFSVFWVDGNQGAPVPNCRKLTCNGAVRQKKEISWLTLICGILKTFLKKNEHYFLKNNVLLKRLLTLRSWTGHIDIMKYFSLSSVQQRQSEWPIYSWISLKKGIIISRLPTCTSIYLVNLCLR